MLIDTLKYYYLLSRTIYIRKDYIVQNNKYSPYCFWYYSWLIHFRHVK